MTPRKAMGCITALLSVFVTMPIWYYLLYHILVAINASSVMWLLYWIYLPVGLLGLVLSKLSEYLVDDEKSS